MNRKFNKKSVSIVSLLTLGLMHTTANAAESGIIDYVDMQKSRRNLGNQQSILHGLLYYQLQMQGLYNQPILRFLQSDDVQQNFAGCKANSKKGLKVADNATEKSDSINSSTTAEARQFLRYSWRASRQQQIAQQHTIKILEDIDAVLNNRALKSIYGIGEDDTDGRSEEERIAEAKAEADTAIKESFPEDSTIVINAPSDSLIGKSYQKLLDIYKDPNSTDYQKSDALHELQADIKITQNFDEDMQRKINSADESSSIGRAHIEMIEAYKGDNSELKLTALIALVLSVHFNEETMQTVLTLDPNVSSNQPIIDAYEQLKADYESGANDKEAITIHLLDLFLIAKFSPAHILTLNLLKNSQPEIRDAYNTLLFDFQDNKSGEQKNADLDVLKKVIVGSTFNYSEAFIELTTSLQTKVYNNEESLTEQFVRDILEESGQGITEDNVIQALDDLMPTERENYAKLADSQKALNKIITDTLNADFWGIKFSSGTFGYKVSTAKDKLAKNLNDLNSVSVWNDQITKPLDDLLTDSDVTEGFKTWLKNLKINVANAKEQFIKTQPLKAKNENLLKADAALGKLVDLSIQSDTMTTGQILDLSYNVASGYVASAQYMKGIAGPIGEQYPVIFRIVGESPPASLIGGLTGFNYFTALSAGTGISKGKSYIVKATDGKTYEAKLDLVLSSVQTEEPTTNDTEIPTDTSSVLGANEPLGQVFKDAKGSEYVNFFPFTQKETKMLGKVVDGDASMYESFYSSYTDGSATNTQGNKWAVKTTSGWVYVQKI